MIPPLLELMTKIEEATKEMSQLEQEFTEKKQPLESQIEEKKGQMSTIDSQIQEKVNQRSEREKELAETILKRYKMIKARLAPAVAQASHGVCLECNMNIPPQMYIELQRFDKIITCPRCHRILFLET